MNDSRQGNRIQVSISPRMRLALDMVREKNGLPASTQARMLLRQSLDRTMASEAFDERLRAIKAHWSTKERLEDMELDREEELLRNALAEGEQEAAQAAG